MGYSRQTQRQKQKNAAAASTFLPPVRDFSSPEMLDSAASRPLQLRSAPPTFAQMTVQRRDSAAQEPAPAAPAATHTTTNTTGLPDQVKSGVESLAGLTLDDVHVHYNSSLPAQVNALAYTQGTDIHVGPGQERHLPHEAWHVVQQKQGRVRPTFQMKGIDINDNKGLEHEADVMGALALTTTPTETGQLAEGAETITSAMQMKPVIQRAVGFEFETGWMVEKEDLAGGNGPDGKPLTTRHSLNKKDPIGAAQYQNFKLEADVAGPISEIEFIIHPPIPESQEGLTLLLGTMNRILDLGHKFLAHKGAPFRLNEVTGLDTDKAYIITPGKDFKAGPQVTIGLDLAAVPAYLKAQGGKDAALDSSNAPIDKYPKLKGMFILMKQYLQRGLKDPSKDTGPTLSYPKIIAEPLLARTDFVGLFNLIEEDRKVFYQQNPHQWVEDVMKFASVAPSRVNEDMISRGVIEGDDETMDHANLRADLSFVEEKLQNLKTQISKANNPATEEKKHLDELKELHTKQTELYLKIKSMETYSGLTILDWLLGIVSGNDKLRDIPTPDSLGEFGMKTEKVGPGGKITGGIFEYRGAQANKINLEEWPTFAVQQFLLVLNVNAQSQQQGQ